MLFSRRRCCSRTSRAWATLRWRSPACHAHQPGIAALRYAHRHFPTAGHRRTRPRPLPGCCCCCWSRSNCRFFVISAAPLLGLAGRDRPATTWPCPCRAAQHDQRRGTPGRCPSSSSPTLPWPPSVRGGRGATAASRRWWRRVGFCPGAVVVRRCLTPDTSLRPCPGSGCCAGAPRVPAVNPAARSDGAVSTGVAAIPLLWVLPLAVYLGSFVVAFARYHTRAAAHGHQGGHRLGSRETHAARVLGSDRVECRQRPYYAGAGREYAAPLAVDRPGPEHLTVFYLVISVGGAWRPRQRSARPDAPSSVVTEYPLALVAVPSCCWGWSGTGSARLPHGEPGQTACMALAVGTGFLGLRSLLTSSEDRSADDAAAVAIVLLFGWWLSRSPVLLLGRRPRPADHSPCPAPTAASSRVARSTGPTASFDAGDAPAGARHDRARNPDHGGRPQGRAHDLLRGPDPSGTCSPRHGGGRARRRGRRSRCWHGGRLRTAR